MILYVLLDISLVVPGELSGGQLLAVRSRKRQKSDSNILLSAFVAIPP